MFLKLFLLNCLGNWQMHFLNITLTQSIILYWRIDCAIAKYIRTIRWLFNIFLAVMKKWISCLNLITICWISLSYFKFWSINILKHSTDIDLISLGRVRITIFGVYDNFIFLRQCSWIKCKQKHFGFFIIKH